MSSWLCTSVCMLACMCRVGCEGEAAQEVGWWAAYASTPACTSMCGPPCAVWGRHRAANTHIPSPTQHPQGEAIAYNLREMFGLRVPIISVVIGEGGSGGALAIGCANKNLIMENAVYYVASPEACAAILWKSRAAAGQVRILAAGGTWLLGSREGNMKGLTRACL